MLSVEHLSKSYNETKAVDDISFQLKKGEVLGLLGPNGAGKSTTMRMIVGFLEADAGSVFIQGKKVSAHSIETRKLVGYLPESAPVYLDMEVVDYLRYIGTLRGLEKNLNASVLEMLTVCGLKTVVGKTIAELSKGYRQRVGIAQALIHKPDLLILDEPTSGLDPNQIGEIRELISELGKDRTVILSTHIMQEVEAVCDHALIMHQGKIVGEGSLAELSTQFAQSGSSYIVQARAQKEKILSAFQNHAHLHFEKWLQEDGEKNRFLLSSANGADHSEEIFSAAVAHQLPLSELRRESASLESVFKELTK